ncbi:hypothetical protein RD792_006012 [Penstemon davidsonii]|uniref:Protein BZR1 homolog n=1 Tax=Penstemon davidsonii TaxID=160366 RepID=A0ABR0DDN7_9LAMI|nr:hypothetical protein RD792_006012 [Penstemon davidsonii]
MTGGTRMPTWKERENNKRRERRRRAFAAKIFCGLRLYGNYTLPKHCDNNEVLKALCNEAGWSVHPDGTTYRKGCKPVENMNFMGRSTSASPCTSYNPSPPSSSIPSPISRADGNSLIPWLRNLSSTSSSSSSKHMHHYMHIGGSMSAPVTPPLSSPTSQTPQIFDKSFDFLPLSTPPSPSRVQIPQSGPTSPTFSLVSSNPFGFSLTRGGSLMGRSGTCSPCVDIPMGEMISSNEFAFGSNNINNNGLVKAWEGERIHEEYCGSNELELTLGTSKTR